PLLAAKNEAEKCSKYKALMSQRVPLYRKVATIRVNTNRRNPGAVVRYIVARLANPQGPAPGRSRRRPPWRRAPSSLTPTVESPPGPPPTPATPAALAAARRHGSPEAGK